MSDRDTPGLRHVEGAVPGPPFDPATYEEELSAEALGSSPIASTLLFVNERVEVWDITLEPGERLPFHVHDQAYFWTVTRPGELKQRFSDGTCQLATATVGMTKYHTYSGDQRSVHDLENVGATTFSCLTVVLEPASS